MEEREEIDYLPTCSRNDCKFNQQAADKGCIQGLLRNIFLAVQFIAVEIYSGDAFINTF